MANKTPNYQLNQWAPEDDFLRSDFNEDNAKIEEALTELETQISAKCEVVFGTYTGDDTANRTISLAKTPKAVLLMNKHGQVYNSGNLHTYGGLALENQPLTCTNQGSGNYTALKIVDGGFTVHYNAVSSSCYVATNKSGITYCYIALV